ncbi:hypothetical protein OBBRIDRAFT_805664 [Obba rivulosa]|uniref:Uncharacterized protein n=1 Tax=Obba rivulosa TaxID=1052685 RepID=A0A8E2DII4_9APHY|nr:hypothetical protein OBBRIDRAFT_805664 [Obba rivulosa]
MAWSSYEKHADARRAYQRRYNAIHRLGRRKISKNDMQDLQACRHDELEGWVYTNDIVRKFPKYDPLCLPWMHRAERDVWNSLLSREKVMRNTHGDDWLEAWRAEVASLPEIMAEQMWGPLPELPDFAYECVGGHDPESLYHHHQRRMVAIYHQFVELLSQPKGLNAIGQATLDNALVIQGRRIKESVVRKLYGLTAFKASRNLHVFTQSDRARERANGLHECASAPKFICNLCEGTAQMRECPKSGPDSTDEAACKMTENKA